jgi:protein SCO1/2
MNFRILTIAIASCWTLLSGSGTIAQVSQGLPEVAKGIGVDQKLGERLPLALEFDDDKNNHIYVNDLFDGKLPVLLSFNYSDCPQLCVVQLNNLASALQRIDLIPGRDFQIVSVSLDPNEQIRKLADTKRNYVVGYGKPETSNGWHFLRGSRENIGKLADACGFRYKYIPDQKIYSHPAAFIFCTPDGRIARYLDGLSGELEQALKPALLEAGQGKVGTVVDKLMYFAGCYVFDPATGKYSKRAIGIMRIGAAGTVLILVAGLVPYWFRRNRRNTPETGLEARNSGPNAPERTVVKHVYVPQK